MGALPDTDVIVFYDIPSDTPSKAWSPKYPDIAALLQSFGLEPTDPGTILPYTLPAIYDPRTKRAVAESAKIAAYLDDTYPDTPAVLPKELRAFQAAFQHGFGTVVQPAVLPLFLPRTLPILTPASQPYFRRTREQMFGTKMEEICPPPQYAAQWAEIERAFGVLAGWMDDAGDGRFTMLGGAVTHTDLSVAGWLVWMRIVTGKESEEWRALEGWHGGRWKRLMDLVEPWYDYSR